MNNDENWAGEGFSGIPPQETAEREYEVFIRFKEGNLFTIARVWARDAETAGKQAYADVLSNFRVSSVKPV